MRGEVTIFALELTSGQSFPWLRVGRLRRASRRAGLLGRHADPRAVPDGHRDGLHGAPGGLRDGFQGVPSLRFEPRPLDADETEMTDEVRDSASVTSATTSVTSSPAAPSCAAFTPAFLP